MKVRNSLKSLKARTRIAASCAARAASMWSTRPSPASRRVRA